MAKTSSSHKKDQRALKLFHGIREASDALASAVQPLLAAHNVSISQFLAMEALCHNGPMNQKELGAKIGRSGGNVTLVVRNLVKAGWVRQEVLGEDRRYKRISMSSEGYTLFMSIYPDFVAVNLNIASVLDGKDQKKLIRLCRSLKRHVDAVPDDEEPDDEDSPEE